MHRVGLLAIGLIVTLPMVSAAETGQRRIERPGLFEVTQRKERRARIRTLRAQGTLPSPSLVDPLRSADLSSANAQQQLSTLSPHDRAQLFVHRASAQGTPAKLFSRRLRGMLVAGKKFQLIEVDGQRQKLGRVVSPHKRLLEVTPDNFELFSQVFGRNMVWFSVSDYPNHLHALIADQNGRGTLNHNVYGVRTQPARINEKHVQYGMGVPLTDGEMDRLVRWINAGAEHGGVPGAPKAGGPGKLTVFGYRARNGKAVEIRCTNWASSAPIGDLPRWVKTVERRLEKLETATLPNGLHHALSQAKDGTARQAIIAQLIAQPGLSRWTKSSIKRMGKAFDRELSAYPNRPADLVLRRSLAQQLGLNRSSDPAKWSYDLLMSKHLPVITVLSKERDPALEQRTLRWEIMGDIAPSGEVIKGSYTPPEMNKSLGLIPASRRPR